MHTPAPWVDAGPIGYGRWIVGGKAQIAVAYGPTENPNAAADTKLMVAAPELLDALQSAAACLEGIQSSAKSRAIQTIVANALTKARVSIKRAGA